MIYLFASGHPVGERPFVLLGAFLLLGGLGWTAWGRAVIKTRRFDGTESEEVGRLRHARKTARLYDNKMPGGAADAAGVPAVHTERAPQRQ